jgi:hypothetical protein
MKIGDPSSEKVSAHIRAVGTFAVEGTFQTILDIPFVTVNRIDGEYLAEVMLSGTDEVDRERIETALNVGRANGVTAYARQHGRFGNSVMIYFTPVA